MKEKIIKLALIVIPLVGGYFLLTNMQPDAPRTTISEPANLPARSVGMDVLSTIYPGMSEQEIDQLLTDSWARGQTYETFTQFREHSRQSKYVNIDPNGFRHIKNQGPWPPNPSHFNIFVFGGSLTFGYGVPDGQSYPSYLQERLLEHSDRNISVYNFGRGHYYSSQELILYETLLMKGHTPDMAIFVDGANDFQYANNKALFSNVFERLTLSIMSPDQPAATQTSTSRDFYAVAKRYLRNKTMMEAVSDAFDVRAVFVWHPVSQYKYDLKYHAFQNLGHAGTKWIPSAYRYMSSFFKDYKMGNSFIWCADIQESIKEPLYVDSYHYTARLAGMLADCIASGMLDRGLID